jgi:hypothetical protein
MDVLGCKHYQRKCKLQAHCCGRWFTCRFCHDEVSDHNIVRNLTTTMMCMQCQTVQPAAQDCIKCQTRVAKYYCNECKLWDDDPRKNIYHCHDCGICRIGKGLGIDYFHCKTCNICMAMSLKGRHKCIERNLESDCPICGEYMFTSTTTVIFMVSFFAIYRPFLILLALRSLHPLQMPSRVYTDQLPMPHLFQIISKHDRILSKN